LTSPPDAGRLFDGQGCLTAAGLAAFQRAAPGRAPAEVAAHVAGCHRCQQRLLSSLREPGRSASASSSRRTSSRSRLAWMVALLIGGLIVLLAGLVAAPWFAR
jgi:uncharacterized paraquat-inducible protein A